MSTLVVYGVSQGENAKANKSGGVGVSYSSAAAGTVFTLGLDQHYMGQDILNEAWDWVWDEEAQEDVWTLIQEAQVWIYESRLQFDTSSLGSGTSVSSAILDCVSRGYSSALNPSLQVRKKTNTFSQWVALPSSMTLVAHYDSEFVWGTTLAKTFADDAMAVNIEKTSVTNLLLLSSLSQSATATHEGWMTIYSADEAGTTRDPKLTVTYADGAAGGQPLHNQLIRMMG